MVNGKKVRFFEGFVFRNWADALGNLTLVVMAIVVSIGLLVILFVGSENDTYSYENTVEYTVESGDTLWTIARHYSNSERQDVRRVIDIIQDVNGCTATIYPGDILTIPVFDCTLGH